MIEKRKNFFLGAVWFSIVGAAGRVAIVLGAKISNLSPVVWVIRAGLSYGISIITQKKYRLTRTFDEKYIYFLKDKPTKQKLDEFIADLFTERNRYLRARYAQISDDNEPSAELGRFRWLYNQGVISKGEFEVVDEEIAGRS